MRIRTTLITFAGIAGFWLQGTTAQAKVCDYRVESYKLTWTGYKFTSKFGVSGSFDSIAIKKKDATKSLSEAVTSVSFRIDTASIQSGDPVRDKKLAKYVFGGLADHGDISGRVLAFDPKKGTATAEISLNGQTKKVPFSAKAAEGDQNKWEFTGKIDMFDFAMRDSVKALAGACQALHTGPDGKAECWSEVGLNITANIQKTCP